jgi:hypothetical protein
VLTASRGVEGGVDGALGTLHDHADGQVDDPAAMVVLPSVTRSLSHVSSAPGPAEVRAPGIDRHADEFSPKI